MLNFVARVPHEKFSHHGQTKSSQLRDVQVVFEHVQAVSQVGRDVRQVVDPVPEFLVDILERSWGVSSQDVWDSNGGRRFKVVVDHPANFVRPEPRVSRPHF